MRRGPRGPGVGQDARSRATVILVSTTYLCSAFHRFRDGYHSERHWKARRTVLKQEYSLAHLTVLGCTPPEMTYIAARAGYDYVSIRLIPMAPPHEPNYALPDNPQMLRQTKTALASTGVRVHDIEVARVHEGLHPSKYLPAMEVAAELGAGPSCQASGAGSASSISRSLPSFAISPSLLGSLSTWNTCLLQSSATWLRRSMCCVPSTGPTQA